LVLQCTIRQLDAIPQRYVLYLRYIATGVLFVPADCCTNFSWFDYVISYNQP